MKYLLKICCFVGLALAMPASMTSCAGVFTQEDAKELGSYVAKESVGLAKLALAGDDSWKSGLQALGIDVAEKAILQITDNLTAPRRMSAAAPEVAVVKARTDAEAEIAKLTNDPATASMAAYIACQACSTAQAIVSAPNATASK